MSETNIEQVDVLKSLKLANSGTGQMPLQYVELDTAAEEYRQSDAPRSNAVWEAPIGSIEEEHAARELAGEHFVLTALKTVHASDPRRENLWADRLTEASIELYGQPDKHEAQLLIADRYTRLQRLRDNPKVSQPELNFLLTTYEPLVPGPDAETEQPHETEAEPEVLHAYEEVLLERFGPIFDLIDQPDDAEYTPEELRTLFGKTFDWLAEHVTPAWQDYAVVDGPGKTIAFDPLSKEFKVPSGRAPMKAKALRPKIAHEVLSHANRAVNGSLTGNKLMATGLPGYLDAEEGIAVLASRAVGGSLTPSIRSYVNVALALGTIDGHERSRSELFKIDYTQRLVEAQAHAEVTPKRAQSLERMAWKQVDRHYRGGRGDELGTRRAILTEGIVYWRGYNRMLGYLSKELAAGKTAAEVFDYWSQGKFDPTNIEHVEYVARLHELS